MDGLLLTSDKTPQVIDAASLFVVQSMSMRVRRVLSGLLL
jgi:hypothetical protein